MSALHYPFVRSMDVRNDKPVHTYFCRQRLYTIISRLVIACGNGRQFLLFGYNVPIQYC